MKSTGEKGFHSFEVGFGPVNLTKKPGELPGFHSFEVGFGRLRGNPEMGDGGGFHSFEVGFGLEEGTFPYVLLPVFIPSR